MRRSVLFIAAAILAAGSAFAKDIQKVTVTTEPEMHCANCESKIKNFFKFEKGIKKIETSVPNQQVTITYDADKTSEKTIIDSFSKIQYNAKKVADSEKKACKEGKSCCGEGKSECKGNHSNSKEDHSNCKDGGCDKK